MNRRLRPPLRLPPIPVHLVGTLRGSILTLSEKPVGGTLPPPYTLVYDQPPPVFTGVCPD